jgi:hypothetical protein
LNSGRNSENINISRYPRVLSLYTLWKWRVPGVCERYRLIFELILGKTASKKKGRIWHRVRNCGPDKRVCGKHETVVSGLGFLLLHNSPRFTFLVSFETVLRPQAHWHVQETATFQVTIPLHTLLRNVPLHLENFHQVTIPLHTLLRNVPLHLENFHTSFKT